VTSAIPRDRPFGHLLRLVHQNLTDAFEIFLRPSARPDCRFGFYSRDYSPFNSIFTPHAAVRPSVTICVSPFYCDPSTGAVRSFFRWQVLWEQRKAESIDRVARYTDNKANARRSIG